jgi:Predicted transcriptional regulator
MQIELTTDQLNILADLIAAKIGKDETTKSESEIMTIPEVADYLKKSIVSVRRYIRKLDFPTPRKIGGEFRFSRKEVVSWFESKKKRDAEKIFRPYIRRNP